MPEWDSYFKRIMENELANSVLNVQPSVKVGTLPLEIDLILVKAEETADLTTYRGPLEQVVRRFSLINIIEFKGPSDYFATNDFWTLQAYKYLYLRQQSLLFPMEEQVTVVIITTHFPERFIKDLRETTKYQVQNLGNGMVAVDSSFHCLLVAINRLEVNPSNYPLLIFSSGQQRRRFIREILRKKAKFFIDLTYLLYQDEVIEVATAENLSVEDVGANIAKAIRYLGLRQVIEQIGIKEVIEQIGIEEVVTQVGLKDVLELIQHKLEANQLTPEEQAVLKKLLTKL
jgi:hypothetical protein